MTEEHLKQIEEYSPHSPYVRELAAEVRRLMAEVKEARFTAQCLANRIREYQHLELTDLNKELKAAEAACPWLK